MSTRNENEKNYPHKSQFPKPIVLYDDLHSKVAYLLGGDKHLNEQMVNFMITEGKGLVYVCIEKDMAKRFNLNSLKKEGEDHYKEFTVSVDHIDSTTGISAFERYQTIASFDNKMTEPKDFQRPGHVFPLISKPNKLLEREGIAEAALVAVKEKGLGKIATVCEILNKQGDIASFEEVKQLATYHNMEIFNFSSLLKIQALETTWLKVENEEVIDPAKGVSVLELKNDYLDERYKVYFNSLGNMKMETIYYQPCHIGDLLNSTACSCLLHFKDYYEQLENGLIRTIVFGFTPERNVSKTKQGCVQQAVMREIERLIKERIVSPAHSKVYV
ncbi:3,4-dihydroxy-2-butanone-4-phosphate synthase [Thalassobacillus sp. C254]|uniref:3,4-dihydroxy-2-butanone-4-phosphate synthase n=1 Tax=Thalassobacillus sp. C254 TaxID=1225341 RepID=UPI0006D0498C|nr:3,4-dihydroxy-2-butanone-4-phosphate synthase [Thalassobacillus sp. C254]